jgi:hypothetical protein
MASLVASLFFIRFYRDTRDPLFLYLAAAFGLESVSRLLLALLPTPNEAAPEFYVMRACAYSLIIAGIVRKNRR